MNLKNLAGAALAFSAFVVMSGSAQASFEHQNVRSQAMEHKEEMMEEMEDKKDEMMTKMEMVKSTDIKRGGKQDNPHTSDDIGFFIPPWHPNVVAYHTDGTHAILLGENEIIYVEDGLDVVLRAGKSNVFIQWFIPNDKKGVGYHSVWRPMQGDSCPPNWIFVENPHSPPTGDTWGDYFPDGVDYCVMTNTFMVGDMGKGPWKL